MNNVDQALLRMYGIKIKEPDPLDDSITFRLRVIPTKSGDPRSFIKYVTGRYIAMFHRLATYAFTPKTTLSELTKGWWNVSYDTRKDLTTLYGLVSDWISFPYAVIKNNSKITKKSLTPEWDGYPMIDSMFKEYNFLMDYMRGDAKPYFTERVIKCSANDIIFVVNKDRWLSPWVLDLHPFIEMGCVDDSHYVRKVIQNISDSVPKKWYEGLFPMYYFMFPKGVRGEVTLTLYNDLPKSDEIHFGDLVSKLKFAKVEGFDFKGSLDSRIQPKRGTGLAYAGEVTWDSNAICSFHPNLGIYPDTSGSINI